jgi:hypothetical protein
MIFLFLFHTELKFNKVKNLFIFIPSLMKKLFDKNIIGIISISLAFLACDKIPNGVVDVQTVDYKVALISAPSSFATSSSDSLFTTAIQISKTSSVGKVWCSVKTLDQTQTVFSSVEMLDNGNSSASGDQTQGDGIYSCKFVMSKKLSNGKYQIEYYVEDNISQSPDNLVKVGAQIFSYDNGQKNYAPAISNLSMPTSATRGTSFIFSVNASDANGLADISQVFFKLFRPDGTTVANGSLDYFLMVDTGDSNYGDQTANDGIYSFKNSFGTSSQTGAWKFEFQAKDKSSAVSNIITYNLTVN